MPDDPIVRDQRIEAWLSALETRHLADLRPVEVARALRALSSAYVERRGRLARGAALDGAGKRAAFALFYGPIHFLLVDHIVRAVGALTPAPRRIVDIGCGTGVAGAAWALAAGGASVLGLDRHPWAVEEARWTYRLLGLDGDARRADAARLELRRPPDAIVAGYVLNELDEPAREALLKELAGWAERGTAVLVVEPISRSVAPWMRHWELAVERSGGRSDEWRVQTELPEIVRHFEQASGLDCSELTGRSLYWPASVSVASESEKPVPKKPSSEKPTLRR